MTNFLEEQDFLGNYIELLVDKLHQSGITIVLVTHEDEVASRAKKIARFKDGKIIELKVK